MLTVSRLSKSFGGRILFEDAALQVNRGERIALIGPNGAGKTTLFSILLGLDEADTGEVALQRGLKVGYLPQESAPVNDETVLEVATALLRDPAANDQDRCPRRIHSRPISSRSKRRPNASSEVWAFGKQIMLARPRR